MHQALRGVELLSPSFRHSWFLLGNHDLFHRNQRDITSVEFAKHVPNITIIDEPTTIEDVIFLPWLLPDEHKSLKLDGRYVFGHLEVAGFLRNAKSPMPETPHSLTTALFERQDTVFSGHFHWRQFAKNVCYLGNAMPFDFRDDGDTDRGLMLLEWGHDPIFRHWPDQPLYQSIKLTELLDHARTVLKPNMTLRVAVDMPLDYEEAQEMRDALIKAYGLRKIELSHSRDHIDQGTIAEDVTFQTVDQIVLSGLQDIESAGLSPQRLIELYQSLL